MIENPENNKKCNRCLECFTKKKFYSDERKGEAYWFLTECCSAYQGERCEDILVCKKFNPDLVAFFNDQNTEVQDVHPE